jgi:glyoxylase-like metal-dependent hydrolase (beta-lactamase superfamily II)
MLIFLIVLFGIVLVACKLPIVLVGLLIAPINSRITWLIEFIYPAAIGRWVHLWLMKWGQRFHGTTTTTTTTTVSTTNAGKYHSRCAETRIELIPQRLYVHPLPQFLDNLGYLIVILPSTSSGPSSSSSEDVVVTVPAAATRIHVTTSHQNRIIGIIVDCGQADAVQDQIRHIRKSFYQMQKIKLHAILSTHKHHDHTAGNVACRNLVDLIVGGAVEAVPGCNTFLADQEQVPLPTGLAVDDDDHHIAITAVAVPSHTRGSLTYALEYRTKHHHQNDAMTGLALFTGDTIFSGGAGVAFEADLNNQHSTSKHLTAHSYIQATTTANAVERCFAHVLFHSSTRCPRDNVLVFPGHEVS